MSGCGPTGCGPGGCRPPGLAPPPPDPEGEAESRPTIAVVGAALAAVGGAMAVLGVLDAMGILRLMGTSPAFLGLCMLFVGGFLILVSRAESVGDEDDEDAARAARMRAPVPDRDGIRRVEPVADDVIDLEQPTIAGRVAPDGPGGASGVRTGVRRRRR